MRVTDIIRGVLDLLDQANHRELDTMVPPDAAPETDHNQALIQMRRMAGILEPEQSEHTYVNTPDEMVTPVATVIASGTDVHASKNPADIRSDSVSMYPGYQKGCAE
jgi:hypothetical protein